eukprot:598710_1
MGTKKRQKRSTLSHRKKATITTGYRNSSNKNGYRQLKQKGARETRIKYNLQRKATRKLASKQEELDQLQNDHKTLQADIEQLRIKLSHAQHLIETNYIFGKLEDINPTHTNHSNNEEYKAPHRETNHMDLMILFELIQYIPYRRLERTLNLTKALSADFEMPPISTLNKMAQSKKEVLNKAIIAFQTTKGSFASDQLTFGTDGSSARGWKFTGGN